MAEKGGGGGRRGPPKGKKKRAPPREAEPKQADEEEWYEEVVDDTAGSGFGGFAVRRPTMGQTDRAEGEQWERYFEKQYHGKADKKVARIEEGWDETEPDFSIGDLFAGHRILLQGVQALMMALPLFAVSAALVWGGRAAFSSMDGGSGAGLQLALVLLALSLSTIAIIQVVVSAINQAMRDRAIRLDAEEIPLIGYTGSLSLAGRLFAEMFLTFCLVWGIEVAGLYMLAGGLPALGLPALDPDNISGGTVLYLLGLMGSAAAMLGVLPYAIQRAIQRA